MRAQRSRCTVRTATALVSRPSTRSGRSSPSTPTRHASNRLGQYWSSTIHDECVFNHRCVSLKNDKRQYHAVTEIKRDTFFQPLCTSCLIRLFYRPTIATSAAAAGPARHGAGRARARRVRVRVWRLGYRSVPLRDVGYLNHAQKQKHFQLSCIVFQMQEEQSSRFFRKCLTTP